MANQTVYPYGTNGSLPSSVGIVNDLKTGGADKALSAEQGKVIGTIINDSTEINLSGIGYYPGLIAAGGAWTGGNAHRFTQLKVNAGEVYRITANQTNYTSYAFLSQLAVWEKSGTPPYAPNESGRHDISAGNAVEFTIPEGCEYLYIALWNSTDQSDMTPQSVALIRNVQQVIKDVDTALNDEISSLRGSVTEYWDYEDADVISNGTSQITIVKDNGKIIVSNLSSNMGKYALIGLPSLVPGKKYKMEITYSAWFDKASVWWLAFVDSSYQPTSGGMNLYPGSPQTGTITFVYKQGDVYLRLASTSQNAGAGVIFNSISITDAVPSVSSLDKRVAALEIGKVGDRSLEDLIRQARYVAASPTAQPLSLLHFTDIHGDTIAATQILDFYESYGDMIDDMVLTGDAVYYFWNSANQGYQWYKDVGLDKALFVLGNHDGAESNSANNWVEGSADWDFKGKEWDFDTYFADYITERGVTPPTGYDDSTSPYYKACYWHKDYADAKVRVIGLDCMHFNDGVRYTSNDQETWLAAKLQETLTSGNSAYGYSVVFLCHYPLDDFTGNNETWDDSAHRFVYNQNANGGAVMNKNTNNQVNFHSGSSFTAEGRFSMRNRIGTVGNKNYTKGNDNPIADVIQSWMNNGGKFVVWLSGHTHTEYMYYPAKYPNMLCVGLSQAGNTRGTGEGDRSDTSAMHSSANLCVIDTQNSLFKIVRFGKTLDKGLVEHVALCYNYSTKTVYRR